MPKITLLSATLSALVFAVLIPVLEVSDTHLFNPDWPAHARLHDGWQMLTNALISALAVILVWKKTAPKLGVTLALIINLSFLVSWIAGPLYGGSMLSSDGTQMAIGGMNVAVLIILCLTILLTLGLRAASINSGAVK